MLSHQILPRVQLYLWPHLWAGRVWPICCHAHIISAMCAEASHFTGLAMHQWHDPLWGRGVVYIAPFEIGSELRDTGTWICLPLQAWEVLDDLPHCLLCRQEGYIPSNYVTEAEDSIEMYEWVCLCAHTVFPEEPNTVYICLYFQ